MVPGRPIDFVEQIAEQTIPNTLPGYIDSDSDSSNLAQFSIPDYSQTDFTDYLEVEAQAMVAPTSTSSLQYAPELKISDNLIFLQSGKANINNDYLSLTKTLDFSSIAHMHDSVSQLHAMHTTVCAMSDITSKTCHPITNDDKKAMIHLDPAPSYKIKPALVNTLTSTTGIAPTYTALKKAIDNQKAASEPTPRPAKRSPISALPDAPPAKIDKLTPPVNLDVHADEHQPDVRSLYSST
jgi:hypothetical protein